MISKWPAPLDLARIYLELAGIKGVDWQELPLQPWETVPFDFESLVKWAYIDRDDRVEDRTRRMVYLYAGIPRAPAVTTDAFFGVTLRLQGFLVSHKIKPLGNYEGYDLNGCLSCDFY